VIWLRSIDASERQEMGKVMLTSSDLHDGLLDETKLSVRVVFPDSRGWLCLGYVDVEISCGGDP
jgi:hypothetical protein